MAERRLLSAVGGLLLIAFFLRTHALDRLPPGWRDDEVIETTMHAQRVLDGDLTLFFPEASGHEPLYHYLSAAGIWLWGRGLFQVRLVSAFFGLLALAAHYRLARRLFGQRVAFTATLLLAFAFWALMYSRVKIRHVSALVFTVLAFEAMVRSLGIANCELRIANGRSQVTDYGLRITDYPSRFTFYVSRFTHPTFLAGLWLGVSLYTYSAARIAPFVLIAFAAYLAVFHRRPSPSRRLTVVADWRVIGAVLLGAGIVSLPMFTAIRAQPDSGARLEEVGRPLAALLAGDPHSALSGALTTLGMFAWTGDPEALYNLPGRPVFEVVGLLLFLGGLVMCAVRWRDPRHAFVLLWLALGLTPAFVSTPAASLGHAILAQPAAYLILALGIEAGLGLLGSSRGLRAARLPTLVVIFTAIFLRDMRDYFVAWPADPLVRRLYRADLREAALWLRDSGVRDTILTGRLSLWDARALALDAPEVRARWFNPEDAMIHPANPEALLVVFDDPQPAEWVANLFTADFVQAPPPGRFEVWRPRGEHERSALAADGPEWPIGVRHAGSYLWTVARPGAALELQLYWKVSDAYVPAEPAIGNSPDSPPQPFTTFVHVLAPDGSFVAGFDRFDADAFSLRPGDVVVQYYAPVLPVDLAPVSYRLVAGLYDPATGLRYLMADGRDSFEFLTVEVIE
jgi:4-amino-4-deoxy-L-arabinose transferase-like glycosyltransferase